MGFKVKKEKGIETKKENVNLLPIDSNNEQFILSHAMTNGVLGEILVDIDHSLFLFTNHKALCQCIQEVIRQGLVCNVDTVFTARENVEHGNSVSLEYIGELQGVFKENVDAKNYNHHIEKLKFDKARYDVINVQLPEFTRKIIGSNRSYEDIVNGITDILEGLEKQQSTKNLCFLSSKEVDDKYSEIVEKREAGSNFISTGFETLNKFLTDGYAPKKISVVAGRPGMCKSSWVLKSILNIAINGTPVALYNFEMDIISIYDRAISVLSEVPLLKIVKCRDKLTDNEQQRLKKARDKLKDLPFYYYENSTQNILGIRREIRTLKKKYDIKVVAYDLFKKIKFYGDKNKTEASVINESLDKIQAMGKDLDVHQVIVTQIGRSADKRREKRPVLSDLKDAGGFEEVADNVFLLYRPSYYQRAESIEESDIDSDSLDQLEVEIAKQRQGMCNVKILFNFIPTTTSVVECN